MAATPGRASQQATEPAGKLAHAGPDAPGAGRRQPFRFGVLQFFSWPNRSIPLPTVYEQALDRIDRMEASGAYDAVWLAEHHFNTYSVCPSVHMMGMHVAARTKRLRIGTAVTLAGMYHPLRLAEEVALLDILSGGRVNWGAGRGNDSTEFGVFGLDRESSYAKFREHVEVVLQCWRNERITYHGDFVHVDNVEVLPKPLQQPHPPVWMAATSPDAIAWASEVGHSILMDPHSSHVDIGHKLSTYRNGMAKAGFDASGRITPIARLLAVAPTDAEALEVARRGASWTVNSQFKQSRARAATPAHGGPGPMSGNGDPIERYVNDVIIHGSPGRVADEIVRLREEIGLDYLLCAPLSFESFVLMTEEVIPALARAVPTAAAGPLPGAVRLILSESLRAAIARAVLDDDANPNGEHLFDGRGLVYACPMQAPDAAPAGRPLIPVRQLLPAGLRLPAFGDYLAANGLAQAGELSLQERARLVSAYEREQVGRITRLLPRTLELPD